MPTDHSVLGRGFRFPLRPAGGFEAVEGADAIAQSLRAIVLTQPGERLGRPQYGAGLSRFLFAPNTLATRTRIQITVAEAIRRDEPRAVLLAVDVRASDDEATRLEIAVRYLPINGQVPHNLVFPFYLDGTER